MSENKICYQPGCSKEGMECYIAGWLIGQDKDEIQYYCSEHAARNGFCYKCGIFSAGVERFDFGPHRGLCNTCADKVDETT